MKTLAISVVALVCPAVALADFSYQQTTQITGGAMAGMMKMASAFSKKAGQPIMSTVLIKDNRMARLSSSTGSIIDLDAQTITTINFEKKTYSVMTFEQMREMMARASEKMSGSKSGDPNLKFKISSKETGRTDTIAGYTAKETVVHVDAEATGDNGQQGTMQITSNIWFAPDVPGYAEVRDFHRRMAEKLGFLPDDQMMGQMRQAAQGMVEISKEMAKLDGVPVRTITQIGGTGAQPQPNGQPQHQAQGDDNANQGGLGALARGFGGFGHKKKDQSSDASAQQSGSGSLIESTTDASGFSSAPVDSGRFDIPTGFRQVDLNPHVR